MDVRTTRGSRIVCTPAAKTTSAAIGRNAGAATPCATIRRTAISAAGQASSNGSRTVRARKASTTAAATSAAQRRSVRRTPMPGNAVYRCHGHSALKAMQHAAINDARFALMAG